MPDFTMIDQYPWLLAIAIFLARVSDVTLGTVRTIVVFRGHRLLAAMMGFVESVIWVIAITKVVQHLDQWYLVLAYAAGFASGNYLGIVVEGKLAIGKEMLRVVSYRSDVALAETIRDQNVSVIEMEGRRRHGEPVQILLAVLPRRRIPDIIALVRREDPAALFTISDVKQSEGEDFELQPLPLARSGWRTRGKRK